MHNFMLCGIFPQLVVACRQLLASYNRRDIQENVVNKKQVGSQWLGSYTRQTGRCSSTNFLIYSKMSLRMLKLICIHPCSQLATKNFISSFSLYILYACLVFTHTVIAQRERNHTILARYIATQQFLVVSPPLCVDNRFWNFINSQYRARYRYRWIPEGTLYTYNNRNS